MIAKTTTGSDFDGALTYGAGQRKGKGKEPGEAILLIASNVLPGTAKEMAVQMQTVADEQPKCKKPVWHTIISWKAGEAISNDQKREAARQYCERIGAPVEQHQLVVYEHRDKKHTHLHLYLNRVPMGTGPALRTSNNFYKQPKIMREISQELGMQPLPERRQSIKDLDPTKEATRLAVHQAVERLLAMQSRGGAEWLAEQLSKEAIVVRYTRDKGQVLRGVSFEMAGVAVKGQEIGYKAAVLREALSSTPLVVKEQGVELPAKSAAVATKPGHPTAGSHPHKKIKRPKI